MAVRVVILVLGAALVQAASSPSPRVIAVDVDGIIHPVTVEIVSGALDQAKRESASLLLVRLNTPGGLMEAMRETIAKLIASPIPVVTYVAPGGGRAASAGFFILEAGDVAAMASGTNTGAAHPVLIGKEMDPVMKQKAENDAAALLRSVVSKHGRNTALAEKAVLESRSFTDKEALDSHLIEVIARDEADLMAQLDGREVTRFNGSKITLHLARYQITTYQRNLRQNMLAAVSDPNIALILLVLGALGIYLEFTSPGLIFPGVAGVILALVGLTALSVLPINWLGAGLLLLALAMFVLEAKFTSHGILGTGGAVAMILGGMLLIDSPVPEIRIHFATAAALAVPFAAITVFLVSLVARARANKVITGREGMIGEIGVALGDLAPEGRVFVHGEYWNAVANVPLAAGAPVRVTGIDRFKLVVEPAKRG